MNKLLIILTLALSISLTSQARTIRAPEIYAYKEAVLSTLNPIKPTLCYGNFYELSSLIEKSQSLEISEGTQPLLVFILDAKEADAYKDHDLYKIIVTTSSDFTKILSVELQRYVKGKVNYGTLKDPIMRDGLILVGENIKCF